eukprot:GHUV01005176.1.p1 GENE.GHUV01005176.1~~GHUV01005176.1.p1  ORF type:complete len:110 (+),score=36.50 GHUV01005176.1:303-632(+)
MQQARSASVKFASRICIRRAYTAINVPIAKVFVPCVESRYLIRSHTSSQQNKLAAATSALDITALLGQLLLRQWSLNHLYQLQQQMRPHLQHTAAAVTLLARSAEATAS